MIVFLIGVILVLTVAIIMLCIRIRLAQSSHQIFADSMKTKIEQLERRHAQNAEKVLLAEVSHAQMLRARREIDIRLLEAVNTL